jgi:hypothetical protein
MILTQSADVVRIKAEVPSNMVHIHDLVDRFGRTNAIYVDPLPQPALALLT